VIIQNLCGKGLLRPEQSPNFRDGRLVRKRSLEDSARFLPPYFRQGVARQSHKPFVDPFNETIPVRNDNRVIRLAGNQGKLCQFLLGLFKSSDVFLDRYEMGDLPFPILDG